MQNLIPLILIAFFVYLLFFRKGGGMGCCGAHGGHDAEPEEKRQPETIDSNTKGEVITLRKDQYEILPSDEDITLETAHGVSSKQAG